ncbi:MAG: hypothetical protein HKN75_02200 [Bacteroidia bacterium]|nr:hypothetical protein [Bacteroidia bacterium]
MALVMFFVLNTSNLNAQTMNEELLAIEIDEPNEPEQTEEYRTFYFADIIEARRKLTQVRTRVEHNFKNNILTEKKYKKQIFSLNNSLEYLNIIEERRQKYLDKKGK